MMDLTISANIRYIGTNDYDLDLFESQYPLPNGVSYNSYVILDEKVAVMDTADNRKTEEWLANLERELGGRAVDYLVIHHMEPDHSAGIALLAERFPEMKLIGNSKTFMILSQFTGKDYGERLMAVKEGDTLSLGEHTLTFLMAPMVHWPEVMVCYESKEKILFSADAFGIFGTLDVELDWVTEARRYYFNIVGKYGMQTQALLKKMAGLDIQTICPLHGPVLKENLDYYIGKYDVWSKYEPEDRGVFIAYASIHGNTAKAARELGERFKAAGAPLVTLADLTRSDMSAAVGEAFRHSVTVLAASSYDAGVFEPMAQFLHRLGHKNFRNRTVALVENGSWGPTAARTMKGYLEQMKDINLLEPVVTIRSAPTQQNWEQLDELIKVVLDNV